MKPNSGQYKPGHPGWNKGHHNEVRVSKINAALRASESPLSMKEIHSALVKAGDFRGAYRTLVTFIHGAAPAIDCARICNGKGKGQRPHKGIGGAGPTFKVGDRVRIRRNSNRTPKWLRSKFRLDTPRTIVEAVRNGAGCRYTGYYLGSNKQGADDVLTLRCFRSCELLPYTKNEASGRPRRKRRYMRQPIGICDSLTAHPSVSPSISSVNCDNLSVEV